MDFSFPTSLMLPNSASPQLNLQAASVFGSHEFSSIEQLPNAKASVAFVTDIGTVFCEDTKYICERIIATFTIDGMSQLLKCDFYPR